MTSEQAIRFLNAIGVKNTRQTSNDWISGSCPLAKWFHKNHSDRRPSFGLRAKYGEPTTYNCYACCRSGTACELLAALEMYAGHSAGYDFALAHKMLDDDVEVVPLPPFEEFPQPAHVFQSWPPWWIDSFVPAENVPAAMEYLTGREVPEQTIKQHNLRYDSNRQMIVCPYYSVYGKLAGARGRSILPNAQGCAKHYDYSWNGTNNAKLVLYNEQALELPGPVVVVEDQFDCWRVEQMWPKVVANLTAKPSREKMKKLSSADFVILIPDNDETGEQSVRVYKKLASELRTSVKVLWLGTGVKDPAECHPACLHDRIEELAGVPQLPPFEEFPAHKTRPRNPLY